jgi:uncharacterized protein (DUF2252 family)
MWLLLACTDVDETSARSGRMRDTLILENQIWSGRPEQLTVKYARMAADPYDFLRGSAGFWFADLARPDPDRVETAYLDVPAATRVLLAGDPHPENFGTVLPGPEPLPVDADAAAALPLEPIDLDGAVFGPWILDVRRAMLGLVALAEPLEGCTEACRTTLAAAFATAYAEEIQSQAAGNPAWDPADESLDWGVLSDLRAEAREDGISRSKLQKYTWLDEDGRRSFFEEPIDEEGNGLVPLTEAESAQVERLFAVWSRRPEGLRVLDVTRRYGVGIASLPAIRYGVLWDRGDDGPDDDQLLNVREVIDPPPPPGRFGTVPGLFDDNAARIEEAAWMLWSRPEADARMAGLLDGGQTFKITTWSGWFREIDHVTIADGWEDDFMYHDVEWLARALGRTLAGVHARGLTADGGSSLDAIADDLGEDVDAFVDERVADVEPDLALLYADHAAFVRLLDEFGPLLGADVIQEDIPR